eukprot:s11_g66.t1
MHFIVDAIDDLTTAEFPTIGYEFTEEDGQNQIGHPELPEEMTVTLPDHVQIDIEKKDRVFLHKDSAGKFCVVRPFDLREAEVPYPDPVLDVVHYVGKNNDERNAVVAVRMEYIRRGRPLRKTMWGIKEVSRLHASESDEFEVYVTPDGDTVWNGSDDTNPEYIADIVTKMREEAQEDGESAGGDDDGDRFDDEDMAPIKDEELFPASSEDSSDEESGEQEPESTKVDLSKIQAEEKVFLHQDTDKDMWYLVRPSDNQYAELKYKDPCIAQVRVGDKWVVVVDSQSQEDGSKPKYAQSLLGHRRAKTVSDPALLQQCSKSGP